MLVLSHGNLEPGAKTDSTLQKHGWTKQWVGTRASSLLAAHSLDVQLRVSIDSAMYLFQISGPESPSKSEFLLIICPIKPHNNAKWTGMGSAVNTLTKNFSPGAMLDWSLWEQVL